LRNQQTCTPLQAINFNYHGSSAVLDSFATLAVSVMINARLTLMMMAVDMGDERRPASGVGEDI